MATNNNVFYKKYNDQEKAPKKFSKSVPYLKDGQKGKGLSPEDQLGKSLEKASEWSTKKGKCGKKR